MANSNLNKYKSKRHKRQPVVYEKKNFAEKKDDLVSFSAFAGKFEKYFYWFLFASVLITLVVYLKALEGEFINWDDDRYVIVNQYLEFTWYNIKFYFTNFYFVMYIPLTMVSYMLDFALGGTNPFVFKLHNLILHLFNTVLAGIFVFKLMKNNKNRIYYAIFTALFFGLNPLHVESVAWIAERKDVLYTFWFFVASILYLKYIEKQKIFFLIMVFVAFLFSLLAKTQAVVLPLVLVIIDYFDDRLDYKKEDFFNFFKLKKLKRFVPIWEKIPFFVLALFFGLLAVMASGTQEPLAEHGVAKTKIAVETDYSFPEKVVYSSYSMTHYFVRLIVPYKMSAIHPYPFNNGEMPVYFYLYLLFPFLFVGILFLFFYKKIKIPAFALSYFFLTVFIVLHIKNFILSEHYTYVPAIGVAIFVCFGVLKLTEFLKNKNLIYIFSIIYFLIFIFLTSRRINVFKNSLTFWNDIEKKYPQVIVTYYNRGNYLQKKGDIFQEKNQTDSANYYYTRAIKDYSQALKLNSRYIGAYSNRGITNAKLHRYKEAIEDFNKVIKIDSTFGDVYSNRGNAYALLGNWEKAISDYSEAIKLKPGFADAYYNRGVAYANFKKFNLAIKDFDMAINLKQDYPEAFLQRGLAYYLKGESDSAIYDFNKLISAGTDNYIVYYYRALAYKSSDKEDLAKKDFNFLRNIYPQITEDLKQSAENMEYSADKTGDKTLYLQAIAILKNALEVNPQDYEIYHRIGVLFGKTGDLDKSTEFFDKAIALNPNYSEAYIDKGYALFLKGDITKAKKMYDTALILDEGNALAYYNRGILFENQNKFVKAIDDLTKALSLQSDFGICYLERGKIYLKINKIDLACDDFYKALNFNVQQAEQFIKSYCKK